MNKAEILAKFSARPDRYYTVRLFGEKGFERRACVQCGRFYWSMDPGRQTCPDDEPEGYAFIGNPPTPKRFDYTEAWQNIETFFVNNGHTSIPRYPVVCRWRDDLYYTIASIVDFQRVAGSKVYFEFPANPLVVPQTCLRFLDIENVGVTGRHFSSFCMVGQHAIPDAGGYWKDTCIKLDYKLLTEQFGIEPLQITFVEDAWIGGGSFGPSLEYFVQGLELGNAVFTEFQGTLDNHTTLDSCIIDMGAGLERFSWITMGTPTAYDCSFGPVISDMIESAGIDIDDMSLKSYYSHVARHLDSTPDMTALRQAAAQAAGLTLHRYEKTIRPLEEIYRAADHIRTLIFAISDGSLPSNVGGGYNLRMMLRRIASADTDIHATVDSLIDYLKVTYPELDRYRADIHTILDIETARFHASRGRMAKIASRIKKQGTAPTVPQLITLYESDGITPEYLREYGAISEVPSKFYPKLAELHQRSRPPDPPAYDIQNIPDTIPLYYTDDPPAFESTVLKSFDDIVILDRTSFYPRGGGQEPDMGHIDGLEVVDVQKHGGVILHFVRGMPPPAGRVVRCAISTSRRSKVTIHHTATHVLNASSRRILGSWVWQHSAYKDEDHARLDITHHSALNSEQVSNIEREANRMVQDDLPVSIQNMERGEAERKYGFGIYQGGVVPVKSVRIVSIGDADVEACGGTHVKSTKAIERIRIRRARRIQDGVVRLEFVAGKEAIPEPTRQDNVEQKSRHAKNRKARYMTIHQDIIQNMKTGRGSMEGVEYDKHACIVYGPGFDAHFHTKIAKKIMKLYDPVTYCGIFRSGAAVRVIVHSGQIPPRYSAIRLAGRVAEMLGGRAVGNDTFAQGGGRNVAATDAAISWIMSELIP